MRKASEVTEVRVEFVVVGDVFDPSAITGKLNMNPDVCWVKGDQVHDWPIRKPDTAWCIGTDYQESLDVGVQVDAVLERIEAKKQALLDLRAALEAEFLFCVVLKVKDGQTPAMCFSGRFIRFMSDIGAELHIDMYCD